MTKTPFFANEVFELAQEPQVRAALAALAGPVGEYFQRNVEQYVALARVQGPGLAEDFARDRHDAFEFEWLNTQILLCLLLLRGQADKSSQDVFALFAPLPALTVGHTHSWALGACALLPFTEMGQAARLLASQDSAAKRWTPYPRCAQLARELGVALPDEVTQVVHVTTDKHRWEQFVFEQFHIKVTVSGADAPSSLLVEFPYRWFEVYCIDKPENYSPTTVGADIEVLHQAQRAVAQELSRRVQALRAGGQSSS